MRLELEVVGGQVVDRPGRAEVPLGTAVTLVVTSDAADQIHVHGYDLTADLAPGQPAEVAFDATVPGVFEVELHDAGTVLLTLQVQ
jgi:heme/copper-type cytochrome/quinol oxidase subunit 2